MIGTALLRELSQLLLKHGASLEDIIGMVYSADELDPSTGKYKKYFTIMNLKRKVNGEYKGEVYGCKITYNVDLSGEKIKQRGAATYTTKKTIIEEVVRLGFENRLEVLKRY